RDRLRWRRGALTEEAFLKDFAGDLRPPGPHTLCRVHGCRADRQEQYGEVLPRVRFMRRYPNRPGSNPRRSRGVALLVKAGHQHVFDVDIFLDAVMAALAPVARLLDAA